MAEGSKAEQRFTHVPFAAAKRQLHALVRKYNQASTNALGFQLHISIRPTRRTPYYFIHINFEKQFFMGDQKSDFNIIS